MSKSFKGYSIELNPLYYACGIIQNEFDGIEVNKPEGTYMLFLHCKEYCKKNDLTIDELIQKGWDVGVAWQQGAPFHDEWGIRMNLAVPYSLVTEAFGRLKRFVFVYKIPLTVALILP